jgi:coenzyme F420-reducing hydrogenase beta subunit
MKHKPETGYYCEAFVGYSNENGQRRQGASGGMATWLLEKLLRENLVDHVACVLPTGNPEKLFEFTICSTPQQIRAAAGSCYYPVETSRVIKHIIANEGRYAIIALPCFCKAIRLAMKQLSLLRDRIRYVLGTVCGQEKSKFFAEYACALGGGDPHHLNHIKFRFKDPGRVASDYGFKFVTGKTDENKQEGIIFRSQGIDQTWRGRYFTPTACGFCDDVYAETADVCFMDAWLPRYVRDWQGHSIMLIRRKQFAQEVRASTEEGSVSVQHLQIREVIASQRSGLRAKRGGIKERIRMAQKEGHAIPAKRLSKCNVALSFVRRRLVQAQLAVSQQSRRQWIESGKNLHDFHERMNPCTKRLRRWQLLWKMWSAPPAVLRRLRVLVNRKRTSS